jgi:hypothetical protein
VLATDRHRSTAITVIVSVDTKMFAPEREQLLTVEWV